MGLFVCDNCQCVENTALGQYWARNNRGLYPEEYEGKALCSECASPHYNDGNETTLGKWHGKFKKEHVDEYLKHNSPNQLRNYG